MRVGRVSRGARADLTVPPGVHEVRATIDCTGSETVRVEAVVGRPVHLTVEPGGNASQFWHVLTRGRYLRLSVD
ncbi:hypothetical protein SAMN06893096_108149 [Geodermatophilus pulveris]|uniref:Uncharacterized protein n=2 Tax=Geodermatophilus pulveris TaxID=1564159 RepID=A0A239HKP9_9ACTN|nr:hypothetical protein SAMN06893096_108149 [Geodermatophilus pulveris]